MIYRERDALSDLPSIDSLPKWQQQWRLSQAEARSLNILSGPPTAVARDAARGSSSVVFHGALVETLIGRAAAETQTSAPVGCITHSSLTYCATVPASTQRFFAPD